MKYRVYYNLLFPLLGGPATVEDIFEADAVQVVEPGNLLFLRRDPVDNKLVGVFAIPNGHWQNCMPEDHLMPAPLAKPKVELAEVPRSHR